MFATPQKLCPLRDFVRQRRREIAGEYTDLGWSGGKERRPQLDRLMADAKRQKFDAVLLARFDRFARSTKHLLTAFGEFQSLGINFMSYTESIDTSTPLGKRDVTVRADELTKRLLAGRERAEKSDEESER